MATQVFLRDALADLAPDANQWRAVELTRGPSNVALQTPTATGPTAGVDANGNTTPRKWLSRPLAAAVTIAGSITMNQWLRENIATANVGAQFIIEQRSFAGAVLSTILNSENGTECTTSDAAYNWAATPTSTAFAIGDRICIRMMANDAGGTMAGSRTYTQSYDGPTAASAGDAFVTFTEAIVFIPVPMLYRNPMPPMIAQ